MSEEAVAQDDGREAGERGVQTCQTNRTFSEEDTHFICLHVERCMGFWREADMSRGPCRVWDNTWGHFLMGSQFQGVSLKGQGA